jgi:hypothetical protein
MSRRTLWFFQRTGPGEIRRISNPSMQRFLVGERALPHDGDGFVRCIGVSLELQQRKPSLVSRVWFSKIRVNDEGKVETAKVARTQAHAAHAGATVVPANHRFALRRLSHLREWNPEERDLAALRAVVNTKAGKQML